MTIRTGPTLIGISARQRRPAARPEWLSPNTVSGIVRSFDPVAGYGWIMPDDGGFDVPVYSSALGTDGFSSLEVGQHVRFALQAVMVRSA